VRWDRNACGDLGAPTGLRGPHEHHHDAGRLHGTAAKRLSAWEFWGRMLVLPYLVVFLVFVLYPVGYGLWLARDPDSYVKLASPTRSSCAPPSTRWCSWWWPST
jgi:hypothetical protein